MLALIYAMERFTPRAPAPLVAVAVGIAASALLGLQSAGIETVGTVPRGLPELVWPQLDLFAQMWPAAAGIALMSFTETIAAARAFGAPDEPRPVPNQELLAIGMANVAGGLLGAMPAGGGTTQTAVNRIAGARTQLAELVTAAVALATLLVLAPLIALMPQAVLAAVSWLIPWDLISPGEFLNIPPCATHRVSLGGDCARRCGAARHAQGHPRGGDRLAGGDCESGLQRSGLRAGAQARHRRVSAAVQRASRRRDMARSVDSAHRRARVLRQCTGHCGEDDDVRRGGQALGVVLDCSAIPDLEYTALKMLIEGEEKLRTRASRCGSPRSIPTR
jgi:hypothetical protein